ncbi:MAG: hypothetical protein P8173_17820, partial [Gammaproteobacteria bacterium]
MCNVQQRIADQALIFYFSICYVIIRSRFGNGWRHAHANTGAAPCPLLTTAGHIKTLVSEKERILDIGEQITK